MNRVTFSLSVAFCVLLSINLSYSQAPEAFKYQSIARDLAGEVLPNSPIGIRISVRDLAPNGTVVFQETHAITTNDFGLFTISVGNGTAVINSLGAIDWANGAKYMQVEADLTGGTSYQGFGTSQLLSVPYALYANSSGAPILPVGTAVGNTPYWDGSSWVVSSNNIYNAGGDVGIGVSTPVQKLDVEGNINILQDSSYMINNKRIVSNKGTGNMFVGEQAGTANTIGSYNTCVGFQAGPANTVGGQNTFVGAETGVSNQDGQMNSFLGRRAGFSNTTGIENTFIGAYAGQDNTEGQHNSFLGVTTGSSNTLGIENSFLGAHAGYFNDVGSYNTFVGNFSGLANTGGFYNTTLGFQSDLGSTNLTNATAIGYGAVVNASNTIVIGNSSVVSIGGQVGWSTLSDKRLKSDIHENQLGLDFINGLKTVSYEYNTKGQQGKRYSGLIAQDVESLMKEMGVEFSGVVVPSNENDFYSIRYSEFVVPLIKAVQEQSDEIEQLRSTNEELIKRLEKIEQQLHTSSN